jgi:cytochrome c oxidase subunit 3
VFWFSTAVILMSSLTIQWSLRSFKLREMRKYRLLVAVTLILGLAFIALQWMGFQDLWKQNITFRGSGAGQFLYVIFGLHAIHVLGGVIALLVIYIKAYMSRMKIYSSISLEVAATYWHFVDLLWVYLLVFFLIIG